MESRAEDDGMNANQPIILIVEDDDLQYEIYEDALASHRLVRAKTGSEALSQISKATPDLLILDQILDDVGSMAQVIDGSPDIGVTGEPRPLTLHGTARAAATAAAGSY